MTLTYDQSQGKIIEESRPNYIALAHELIHAYRNATASVKNDISGFYKYVKLDGSVADGELCLEEAIVTGLSVTVPSDNRQRFYLASDSQIYKITENMIRREQGLNIRATYQSEKEYK